MSKVMICGASDDLIEIRGDLGSEEWGCYAGTRFLHFNDGTVIKVWWDEDTDDEICWRIEAVHLGDGATITIIVGETGPSENSQVVELTGGFTKLPHCWDRNDGPDSDDFVRWTEDLEYRDKSPSDWKKWIMAFPG